MTTEQDLSPARRFVLAAKLLAGEIHPLSDTPDEQIRTLWGEWFAESEENEKAATEKANTEFPHHFAAQALSVEADAWLIVYNMELDRRRAVAREPRIRALAALLPDPFVYTETVSMHRQRD